MMSLGGYIESAACGTVDTQDAKGGECAVGSDGGVSEAD